MRHRRGREPPPPTARTVGSRDDERRPVRRAVQALAGSRRRTRRCRCRRCSRDGVPAGPLGPPAAPRTSPTHIPSRAHFGSRLAAAPRRLGSPAWLRAPRAARASRPCAPRARCDRGSAPRRGDPSRAGSRGPADPPPRSELLAVLVLGAHPTRAARSTSTCTPGRLRQPSSASPAPRSSTRAPG